MSEIGRKISLAFLFLFLLIPGLYSQSGSENFYILKWEESKGAKAYHIQVKDENGKVLVDEKTSKTEFRMDNLSEGKYEHRVGVYNKFNKISAFSEWERFSIVQAPVPEISSAKGFEWEEDSGIREMKIEGNYFQKKMKVFLYSASGTEMPIYSLSIQEPGLINLSIDTKKYPVDSYTLLLENPRNKKLKVKEFIKITKKTIVVIEEPPKKEETPPSKKETEVTEKPPKKEETPPSKKETEVTEIPSKKEEVKISERYPYWKEGFQSALFPGLGQWKKEQKIKSVGFGILFWGSVGYFFATLEDFNQAKSRYNNTVFQTSLYPVLIPDQTIINLYAVRSNESFYQTAVTKSGLVQSASVGVGVIYLFNILDALFWKTSKREESSFQFRPGFEFQNASTSNESKIEAYYRMNWTLQF